MFSTDDVKIKVDAIVKIGQKIKYVVRNGNVILQFEITGFRRLYSEKFENLKSWTGNMKDKINRRNND